MRVVILFAFKDILQGGGCDPINRFNPAIFCAYPKPPLYDVVLFNVQWVHVSTDC
jgi:hypothetical protein